MVEASKARTAAGEDFGGPLGSDEINHNSEVRIIDFGYSDLIKISPKDK